MTGFIKKTGAAASGLIQKLASDFKQLKRKNADEDIVLGANYFSAYKKKFVIKKAGFDDRCFSFGILFISPNLNPGCEINRDAVRHEYGHTKQLDRLGPIKYYKHIGKPSMKSTVAGDFYYEQPWEVFADIEGGVISRRHDEETVQAGYNYLDSFTKKR